MELQLMVLQASFIDVSGINAKKLWNETDRRFIAFRKACFGEEMRNLFTHSPVPSVPG